MTSQTSAPVTATVRLLDSPADCALVTPLCRAVWGTGAPELSVDLLRAVVHTGGYLSGVYVGFELVGFCLGLLAEHGGQRSLHSHAAAVLPSMRRHRLGLALKEHQREWARSRALPTISWTFDPLVRRNATFNLTRLGARPVEYLEDFYGRIDDDLNGCDDSDRLFVLWDVESPEPGVPPAALLVGAEHAVHEVDGVPIVTDTDADVVLIDTPADVEALRRNDPGTAALWRHAVREGLGSRLETHRVVGLTADGEYVLTPASDPRGLA